MDKKKTAPKGVEVIVREGTRVKVFKPGHRSRQYFWRYFEMYIFALTKEILPDSKVEEQKEFGKDVRVDVYISGEKKILIEVKHYTSARLSAKDVDKLLRDRKAANPDETWLVVSHTTPAFSPKLSLRLYKEKIRVFRAGLDWEKKFAKALGGDYGDDKPGSASVKLAVEWRFLIPGSKSKD